MNTQYEKGTRIMIELCNGKIYEGTFLYGDDMRVSITKLSEYPDNIKYDGLYHFYQMEIQSITVLEEKDSSSSSNSETKGFESHINPAEYDKLKDLSYKFKYLAVVDNRFYSAIDYIKMCTEIAVIGYGNLYGRNSKISILGIATKREIFLIDLKIAGTRAFDMGLQEILESDDISKTVHDSKILADCLHHIYNISLKNVFDTQIADYMLIQKKEGAFPEKMQYFADCVQLYLNIPGNIIKNYEVSQTQFAERPLADEIKLNLALQVGYLYNLKNVLNKKMLENFNLTTECYLNCMKFENPVNSLKYLKIEVPEKVKELGLTL